MSTLPDDDSPKFPQWVGIAAAFVLLIAYVITMCRGLMFFDAGEFALVGQTFGLGHPPGQPLYTMLLGFAAACSPESPLSAMTLVSAITIAACAIPADRLMIRAGASRPWPRFFVLLACGTLYPVWDQATRIELYGPMTLIMLITMAYAASVLDGEEHRATQWFWLGLGAGLAVSINPIHGLALALGVGLTAVPALWKQGVKRLLAATGSAALGSSVGLIPYGYVFFVRHQQDRFVWGDLDSTNGLYRYFTGADYAHTDHGAWGSVFDHAIDWLLWMQESGGAVLVVMGMIGLWAVPWLFRRCPLWLIPVLIGGLFSFSYGVYYPEIPDFSGYLLPAIWCFAIGAAALLNRGSEQLAVGLAIVLVGGPMVVTGRILPDRSDNDLGIELAKTWLESLPKNSIFIADTDHLVFPSLYVQQAQGIRRDIVLINSGFGASSWFWNDLFRRHPGLQKTSLAAPNTGARIRRFLLANRDRPHRIESISTAGAVGIRPCVVDWGLALGAECRDLKRDDAKFETKLRDWWMSGAAQDPISVRILASLGFARAQALLAQGDIRGALVALRAGAPAELKGSLQIPEGVVPAVLQMNWAGEKTLIGDPRNNLMLGIKLLEMQKASGAAAAAKRWRDALDERW